jgi:hypothetical protein
MTRATDRGHEFEHRVARLVDGTVYVGQGADVDVTGTNFRLECKYVQNLRAFKAKEYHDQILDYEKRNTGKRFGLVYTGGKPYQNARVWVSVPLESFNEYVAFLRRRSALQLLEMGETDGIESKDQTL